MNINGNSLQSDPETIYACDSPSNLSPPQYVSSDRVTKQISLTWNVPQNDGGCPITGFKLYRDDGGVGLTNIPITMSSTDPSLSSVTISLPGTATVGNIYSFVLEAINNAGSVQSNALLVALASLPIKPTTLMMPYSDPKYTNRE